MINFLKGLLIGSCGLILFMIIYFPFDFFSEIGIVTSGGKVYEVSRKEAVSNFTYRESESVFLVKEANQFLKMELDSSRNIKRVVYYYGKCDSSFVDIPPSSSFVTVTGEQ